MKMEMDLTSKKRVFFNIPSLNKMTKLPGLQWLLLIIPIGYVMVLLGFSLFGLLKLSIYKDGFTLDFLIRFFQEPVYLKVLFLTLKIAFIVTLSSLLLSYPVAYLLVGMESEQWRRWTLGAVMVPFWISLLVRSYSWTLLLQTNGAINKLLIWSGIIDTPIKLLYNTIGVTIGMTHVLIPYMVLSLYSVMSGIDRRLVQAAEGLGARPWQAFFQVFMPLSLPGILSGSLLVFVLGIGYFITPALLGGPDNTMISQLIQVQIDLLNWNFAAAISIILLVVTLLLLAVAYGVLRKFPGLTGVK